MYRSFVTCDDPKGVVTCRTIRKSKPKPNKMEDKRKRNTLSSYFDSDSIMASGDEIHTPASFQLMEVSRGARNLNTVIDIWSKGGGQPNDIADDLLRGAIDLQDSLLMLGKLQEASHYMARLKKESLGPGRPRPDRTARISSPGPTEELKNVIRESLVNQSLGVPKSSREESSSASATESLSTESSSRSSSSSVVTTKGPNLIARLMGLGEYPSRPVQLQPPTQKARDEPEKRSLKEILDGMRFKGVLRTGPTGAEDGSPIVLIKPVRAPCPEPCRSAPSENREEAEQEEDPLYRRKLLRRFRRNEELRPKEFISREKIVPNNSVKPVSQRQQPRIEGPERRSGEAQKVFGINGKVSEKVVVKSRSVVKPEEQGKRVLVKAKKLSSEPNSVKNQKTQNAKPSVIKRPDQKIGACSNSNVSRKNHPRKDKPVKKSTVSKVIETSGREQGERTTEISSESDCRDVTVDTNLQLTKEESADISNSNSMIEDIKTFKTEDNLKAVLLTSPTFQTRAEELFDLATDSSSLSRGSSRDHYFGAKLLLDCASEIIERKSSRESQTVQITCSGKLRRRGGGGVSLEALAEEVCESVDALRSYRDHFCAEGLLPMDRIYAMMERDLSCGGAMNNGLGGVGWSFEFSMDEAERVVSDVEKLVLSGLIEEVFA